VEELVTNDSEKKGGAIELTEGKKWILVEIGLLLSVKS